MFELLVSGDAVVPDHDEAVARCEREWGLPPVHPNWTSAPPGAGGKWSFARLQRDRRLAPTALEILGIPYHPPAPEHRPDGYAYLPEIAASQGDRPVRNHSTVVSVADVAAVAERIAAAGGQCRLDAPDATLPFPRLWVGFTADRPDTYDAATDGGIRLELIPHQALAMPDPGPGPDLPGPTLDPGAPVRITARTVLVDDLDACLAVLEANLGWAPTTVATGRQGERRARFSFRYPRSATLELVAPAGSGAEAEFLAAWGPGPFSVRIAVTDVATLRRRFVARGVPHEMLPAIDHGDPPRLFRPPERRLGTGFEFVPESP